MEVRITYSFCARVSTIIAGTHVLNFHIQFHILSRSSGFTICLKYFSSKDPVSWRGFNEADTTVDHEIFLSIEVPQVDSGCNSSISGEGKAGQLGLWDLFSSASGSRHVHSSFSHSAPKGMTWPLCEDKVEAQQSPPSYWQYARLLIVSHQPSAWKGYTGTQSQAPQYTKEINRKYVTFTALTLRV